MSKYISVTDTAKIIRGDLKKNFPHIKFSVRSKSYSMGASIDISYSGNVTQKAVQVITNKYVGSTFDGMIDLKSYVTGTLNGETVHFGSDHVFVNRLFTVDEVQKFADFISEHYHFVNYDGKEEKPVYTISDSEWSGASVNPGNNVLHRNRYFESFVGFAMHDYKDFNEFLQQEHPEFVTVIVTEPKEEQVIVSSDGITVVEDRDWTWVNGVSQDNKETQETLKLFGCKWSNKRKSWYYTQNVKKQLDELLGVL